MTGDFSGSYSTKRVCHEGVLGLRISLLPIAVFRGGLAFEMSISKSASITSKAAGAPGSKASKRRDVLGHMVQVRLVEGIRGPRLAPFRIRRDAVGHRSEAVHPAWNSLDLIGATYSVVPNTTTGFQPNSATLIIKSANRRASLSTAMKLLKPSATDKR